LKALQSFESSYLKNLTNSQNLNGYSSFSKPQKKIFKAQKATLYCNICFYKIASTGDYNETCHSKGKSNDNTIIQKESAMT
jgi:hypothetical protein